MTVRAASVVVDMNKVLSAIFDQDNFVAAIGALRLHKHEFLASVTPVFVVVHHVACRGDFLRLCVVAAADVAHECRHLVIS